MSTFATNTDVVSRLRGGEDTLESLTGADPYDAAKVTAARQKAYGIIIGHVGRRYTLPADLAGHPDLAALLRELEIDLVEWYLWAAVREDVPARVEKIRQAALSYLERVAKGELVLPAVGELPATDKVSSQAETVGPERVFTRDDMDGVF